MLILHVDFQILHASLSFKPDDHIALKPGTVPRLTAKDHIDVYLQPGRRL